MKVPNGDSLAKIQLPILEIPTIKSKYSDTFITLLMKDGTIACYVNDRGKIILEGKYKSIEDFEVDNNCGDYPIYLDNDTSDELLLFYIKKQFPNVKTVWIEDM